MMVDSRRELFEICGNIIYETEDPDVYVLDSEYHPESISDFESMFSEITDTTPQN